jgi:hypothetical protein
MELYKKLLRIQDEVKGLSKDKKSHNYGYVTGNKLLSFIKPLMSREGLLLKQEILSIENTRQDYKVWDKWVKDTEGKTVGAWKPKNEILSKVMMKFTWIDADTGDKDENLFGANGQNDWEKGLGSALTYGERYFLLKYFHIATDEDDIDNPDRKPKEDEPVVKAKDEERLPALTPSQFQATKKATKAQIQKVLDSYRMSADEREVLSSYNR